MAGEVALMQYWTVRGTRGGFWLSSGCSYIMCINSAVAGLIFVNFDKKQTIKVELKYL